VPDLTIVKPRMDAYKASKEIQTIFATTPT
jgi:hypothetical protein